MICIGRIIGGDGGKEYFSGSCLGLVNSSSLSLTVKDELKRFNSPNIIILIKLVYKNEHFLVLPHCIILPSANQYNSSDMRDTQNKHRKPPLSVSNTEAVQQTCLFILVKEE